MATKTTKTLGLKDTPLVYGEGETTPEENPTGGSGTTPAQDTPQDPSVGSEENTPAQDTPQEPAQGQETQPTTQEEMSTQESIQAQLKRGSVIVDMGPNYKETYSGKTKGASLEAGAAQASNMQTATTVGSRIPQVDTSAYAERARFTANGKNAGKDSDFAVKATGEGAGYKPTKDVKKNAFPETGEAYKEIVNTQSY